MYYTRLKSRQDKEKQKKKKSRTKTVSHFTKLPYLHRPEIHV